MHVSIAKSIFNYRGELRVHAQGIADSLSQILDVPVKSVNVKSILGEVLRLDFQLANNHENLGNSFTDSDDCIHIQGKGDLNFLLTPSILVRNFQVITINAAVLDENENLSIVSMLIMPV